jgi:hypothetical protein
MSDPVIHLHGPDPQHTFIHAADAEDPFTLEPVPVLLAHHAAAGRPLVVARVVTRDRGDPLRTAAFLYAGAQMNRLLYRGVTERCVWSRVGCIYTYTLGYGLSSSWMFFFFFLGGGSDVVML